MWVSHMLVGAVQVVPLGGEEKGGRGQDRGVTDSHRGMREELRQSLAEFRKSLSEIGDRVKCVEGLKRRHTDILCIGTPLSYSTLKVALHQNCEFDPLVPRV